MLGRPADHVQQLVLPVRERPVRDVADRPGDLQGPERAAHLHPEPRRGQVHHDTHPQHAGLPHERQVLARRPNRRLRRIRLVRPEPYVLRSLAARPRPDSRRHERHHRQPHVPCHPVHAFAHADAAQRPLLDRRAVRHEGWLHLQAPEPALRPGRQLQQDVQRQRGPASHPEPSGELLQQPGLRCSHHRPGALAHRRGFREDRPRGPDRVSVRLRGAAQ